MGQFSVKTYNPPGSLLSATQQKVVREVKIASEPEALVRYFGGLEIPVSRIGLEAGPLSQWLYAGLVAAGFDIMLLEILAAR